MQCVPQWEHNSSPLRRQTHQCSLEKQSLFILRIMPKVTRRSRVFRQKHTLFQVDKKYPELYRNNTSIIAHHVSHTWARSNLSTTPHYFLNTHFNIILSSTPTSSKWSLSLRIPHQNPASISHLPHICHMPMASYSSSSDQANGMW
jgi:hypothetical protein